jgi:translocation and assembly module TamA
LWTVAPEVGFSVSRLRYAHSRYTRTEPIFTPEVSLSGHTNDYELYQGDPRRGFDTTLRYAYVPGAQASSIGVHRFLLTGTYLYNFKSYVQPRWILGLRYKFGTLFTVDGTTPDASKTPPDWFFLVGGDQDLRGFSRNTLPSQFEGAGSVATSGLESRWPGLFSFPLDPLVFVDAGYLGPGNSHFSRELIVSPGFGVRSATPLGTIRATYARGYQPAKNIYRSQVFLSFGAEF